MTLYYTRMCDKVLTAFKVNCSIRQRLREETADCNRIGGYITTDSHEMQIVSAVTHRDRQNYIH